MTQLDKTNLNNSSEEVTVDIKELVGLLWGGRKLIISVTSVIAVCTMFYALSLTDYYKSDAIMSILETSQKSAGLTGMGGLASFAGIDLSSENTKGAMIVNTVGSRSFVKHLMSFDGVLPSMMAAESYDSESKKIVFDSDIYDATKKEWIGAQPHYLEAWQKYRNMITVEFHDVRNILSLEAEHVSPIFVQEFLTLIIREADNAIRQQDTKRSSEAIEYLTSELSRTALTEIRTSINHLLQRQLEQQMRGGISSNFVINVIDPPYIPIMKSKPSRTFICLVGTLFGFVIGVFWVVLRHYYALSQIKQTPT